MLTAYTETLGVQFLGSPLISMGKSEKMNAKSMNKYCFTMSVVKIAPSPPTPSPAKRTRARGKGIVLSEVYG